MVQYCSTVILTRTTVWCGVVYVCMFFLLFSLTFFFVSRVSPQSSGGVSRGERGGLGRELKRWRLHMSGSTVCVYPVCDILLYIIL